MSINFDSSLILRARVFAVAQLHTIHHTAEAFLIPYISVSRRIVANAIKEYPLLRSAEEFLLPQPSYENLTFHAERGACVWTISSTGLPADFSPHTGTLLLLLTTNVCTAIACFLVGTAIFAPLRIVWRSTNALVSLATKPNATWETVLEDFATALAHIAAAGNNLLVFYATCLVFCIGNATTYAANLDVGIERVLKRPEPRAESPLVLFRTLQDPRVPDLEEKNRRLETELEEQANIAESSRRRDAATISGLIGKNDAVEEANKAQKRLILNAWEQMASVDMTRSVREQFNELKRNHDSLQGDHGRLAEEKKQAEKEFAQQLGERTDDIRYLKKNLRATEEENAELLRSRQSQQDQAGRSAEVSRVQIESQRQRIQELGKGIASQKETLEARIKELDELIASQNATMESLEAQLKGRDEVINTQKEAMQALEVRIKEERDSHASQKRSSDASLRRNFDRELKKALKASQLNADARKTAEEARKEADEARETAEEVSADNWRAREAADEACKAAEEKFQAAGLALKAAEEARKAAEEESATNLKACKAAEEESASLREQLANLPPSHGYGPQSSNPPGSPRKKTPPGSPSRGPPPKPGNSRPPPPGLRPILPARSVRNPKLNLSGNFGAKKEPVPEASKGPIFPSMGNFEFNFSNGASPKTPPAGPSAPEPSTPQAPSSPPAAPSQEPKTAPGAPSLPEPAPTEGSSGEASGDSGESKQPEAVNPTPAESSPAKPASPSGEQPEGPEPASA
ncbi:hypothetical protein UCDDA912_g05107 [Diaporthe ampelina]|uniref:Uncharacterized protein n=1 Tax=Diaporthe ampelina TaxID=1214573 RepID=A0A0G2FKP6_9PEZI|nr:hypothetical protein UCDDA912_g05107 [Diaporthe ampelina]